MATYLKGIGDSVTRVNEISPSFDAKILQFIVQKTEGVCGTENSKFPLASVDRGVQVGAGMVQAFGYFGMNDSPVQLNFVYPAGSSQYAKVYAEINLSTIPHQFNIKATAQSSSSNIPLIQDDLSTAPSGIYQVPLYLLAINSNNTITMTDQRNIIEKIHQANLSDEVTTTIAGRAISNVFETSSTVVKNATLAETSNKSLRIEYVTANPSSNPPTGTLQVYVSSTNPTPKRDRVLYLITV